MNQQFPRKCACCRMGELQEAYETCEICGWIADPEQELNETLAIGRNSQSFQEYKQAFMAGYGMCYCAE